MTRAILSAFVLSVALVPLAFESNLAEAQDFELRVAIDPGAGTHGTTVTIAGSGAPANEEVVVIFSPWFPDLECETPRGGDLVATAIADGNGEFTVTHEVVQFGNAHIGNTYLAFIPEVDAAQPMSNLECFEFEPLQAMQDIHRNALRLV